MDLLFPIVLILLVFLVLIVLPARTRKKAAEKQKTLQDSLIPGAPVMLTSGIYGTVAGVGEGTVDLEIAPGVVVTVVRQAILERRTPAGAAPLAAADDDEDSDDVLGSGATRSPLDADGDPSDRSR